MNELSISRELISGSLSPECPAVDINIYDCVGSTNTVLRAAAAEGRPEGCTVIAAAQTSGRGRYDRSFCSPAGTGLYMSILLRPEFAAEDTPLITTAAAVAVAEAIKGVSGRECAIKWVNDIYMDGRKVCGILAESAFASQTRVNYTILGIGVNVFPPENGFPDEIAAVAGSVFSSPAPDMREKLAAEIINSFFRIYPDVTAPCVAEKYRALNMIPGKDVTVLSSSGAYPARAVDIDDRCGLIVRLEDGSEMTLAFGEVSIRV